MTHDGRPKRQRIAALGLPAVLLGLLTLGCGDTDEPSTCEKVLRRAVTRSVLTFESSSIITQGETVCTFDRPSLTHVCEYFDVGEDGAKTFRNRISFWWATLGDLRKSRRTVGVETALGAKMEALLNDPAEARTCAANFEFLYDGAGRWTGEKITIAEGLCEWGGTMWTEWDQVGRPTSGRGIDACTGQDVTQTFDDAKRAATRTTGDGVCGPTSLTDTFDEFGILLRSIVMDNANTVMDNANTTEITYEDRETIDVCP